MPQRSEPRSILPGILWARTISSTTKTSVGPGLNLGSAIFLPPRLRELLLTLQSLGNQTEIILTRVQTSLTGDKVSVFFKTESRGSISERIRQRAKKEAVCEVPGSHPGLLHRLRPRKAWALLETSRNKWKLQPKACITTDGIGQPQFRPRLPLVYCVNTLL